MNSEHRTVAQNLKDGALAALVLTLLAAHRCATTNYWRLLGLVLPAAFVALLPTTAIAQVGGAGGQGLRSPSTTGGSGGTTATTATSTMTISTPATGGAGGAVQLAPAPSNGGGGGGGAAIGANGGGGSGGDQGGAGGGGGAALGSTSSGGAGGNAFASGTSGAGASISIDTITNNSTLMGGAGGSSRGGAGNGGGGAGIGGGGGGAGGWTTPATTGGAGGTLNDISPTLTIINSNTITGGAGATGITDSAGGGGGGAGIGGGGGGAQARGNSAAPGGGGKGGNGGGLTGITSFAITNTGTIAGGAGGAGGTYSSLGGTGGDAIGAGGSAGGGTGTGTGGLSQGIDNAIIINSGTIQGGAGGAAGGTSAGGGAFAAGAGGAGIRGSNLTITDSGTIAGGLGGNGATRANAITFTAGTNLLELRAGYAITGNVVGAIGAGASNSLILGGTANSSFDASQIAPSGSTAQQYQNFTSFRKTGTSLWSLSNTTTALTPWTVSGGTLSISADGSLGAVSGDLTLDGGTLAATNSFSTSRAVAITANNGTVDVAASQSLILSGVISGAGALTKAATGTLVLTGTDTYSGSTTIAAGTLQLGNGGTTGSIAGNVIDNGVLAFDRSDGVSFAGAISGAGSVNQTGTGTTTLSGTNSYAGGTTITAGTLVGSATSFGTGVILDNAALVIDQPADAVFANAINGGGSFTKQGAGRLNYTGTGTLSGLTTVAAGLLSVNGSLASSAVTVQSGATLGGNGTVGATTIQSGGIIAPGNGVGTLHVNGALVQNSGAIYNVEVDPNTNASDLIQVDGPSTLQSGAGLNVIKAAPGDYRVGTVYTVLSASGGASGIYALSGQTQGVSAFLGLKDSYDPNHAYLTVVQTGNPIDVVETPNQGAVAPNIPDPVVPPILNSPSDAAARDAFDQLSGAAQASARDVLVSNGLYVRNGVLERLRDVICTDPDKENAHPLLVCTTDRPLVWAQGFGGWGGAFGNTNAPGVNHSTAGLLVGADVAVMDWRLGFFGGYSHSDFHAVGMAADGGSDDYHLGIYGGTHWDALALRLGASYSWDGITTDRSVTFGSFSDQLHGYNTGGTTQIFGEMGYGLGWDGLKLEPIAGLSYLNLRMSAYREGGGDAALTVQASGLEDVVTTLGVRPSMGIDLGGMSANLRGLVGWRHTFGDVLPIANVAFSGGNFFSVSGAPIARDAAALEAGLDFVLADGISAGLTYGGQISDRSIDQEARGSIRLSF